MVVPLQQPHPFGIAVLACTGEGDLQLHWMSNAQGRPKGPYRSGRDPPCVETLLRRRSEVRFTRAVYDGPRRFPSESTGRSQAQLRTNGGQRTAGTEATGNSQHPYVWWNPWHDDHIQHGPTYEEENEKGRGR